MMNNIWACGSSWGFTDADKAPVYTELMVSGKIAIIGISDHNQKPYPIRECQKDDLVVMHQGATLSYIGQVKSGPFTCSWGNCLIRYNAEDFFDEDDKEYLLNAGKDIHFFEVNNWFSLENRGLRKAMPQSTGHRMHSEKEEFDKICNFDDDGHLVGLTKIQ